ncbi:hypothetical protein BDV39DRAFT_167999 [Aspergillus sergii]|uniref:Uncharacterized protein n=1 Tax=Aspergillus sergii TaxID=1034303 RepID=A0A5N6XGH2_9EURO|nr:hypothetical protein BDV39DRAFT_167999 [Aspergillus sergii]
MALPHPLSHLQAFNTGRTSGFFPTCFLGSVQALFLIAGNIYLNSFRHSTYQPTIGAQTPTLNQCSHP